MFSPLLNLFTFLYLENNLCWFLDSVNISKLLWKDVGPLEERLFPSNKFGQYVLQRNRVVKKVKEAIALQKSSDLGEGTSVYLAGCRGSG